ARRGASRRERAEARADRRGYDAGGSSGLRRFLGRGSPGGSLPRLHRLLGFPRFLIELDELDMGLREGGIFRDRALERRHRIGPAAQPQVGDTELLEVRREFLEILLIGEERLQRFLRTTGPGQGVGPPPGLTEQSLQIDVMLQGGGDLAESLQSLASLLLP